MTASRTLICLVLACVFLFTWSFWDLHNRSRSLAKDVLQASCNSIYEEIRHLLESYEDELRITHSPKLEPLQGDHRDISAFPRGQVSVPASRHLTGVDQIDICASLAGKRIAMIGGEHIYRLHLSLLQQRERAEGKPFPCQYREFCTHHHICLSSWQHFRDDVPPPRYIKSPTAQELVQTESAMVNYIVSDTLFSSRNESSYEYTSPFVDSMTSIRLRETYWLMAARKANIIILGRGPLSPPAQTYFGNWSFLHHLPDYVNGSRIPSSSIFGRDDDTHLLHQYHLQSKDILNAAVHCTVSRFLPDLFQLLRAIQLDVHPSKQKRMIWPSSWFRFPSRGNAKTVLLRPHAHFTVQEKVQQTVFRHSRPQVPLEEHTFLLQLSALITADITKKSLNEDPWTLFYNAQVFFQNMVLSKLLPRYGILFLPLNIPWVENNWARGGMHGYSRDFTTDIELEQMAAIDEAFLMGLDSFLQP